MSKPPPARYRTTNWAGDTASLRQRGSLLIRGGQGHDLARRVTVGPDGRRSFPMPPSGSACRRADGPLTLLVDSTGIKLLG